MCRSYSWLWGCRSCHDYGYLPNATKTCSQRHLEDARGIFEGITITVEGRRHQGAHNIHRVLCPGKGLWMGQGSGTPSQHCSHANSCSLYSIHTSACKQLKILDKDHPRHCRPTPTIGWHDKTEVLAIHYSTERLQYWWKELIALQVWPSGLGIGNPCRQSVAHYAMSEKSTAPIAALIVQQSESHPAEGIIKQLRANLAN